MNTNIRSAMDAMKQALAGANGEDFAKAYNVAFGLVNYDLEPAAKLLFPWGVDITPLRNETSRRTTDRGDTAHRFKVITGINTNKMPPGVSEGNRSGVVTSTELNRLVSYAGLGEEDFVTEEARYASMGFDDILAVASENLLKSVMIDEEHMILGGNSSVSIGQPGTVTVANGHTTGGALSNSAYYVGVVALTNDGWYRATVANGVVQQIVRTNADGTSDTINGGTSTPSAVQTATLSGGGSTQTAYVTVPVVTGAVAYAWYIGTSASHQYLSQITTINSAEITAVPASTFQDFATLAAADYSAIGSFGFDGLMYQTAFGASTNAYLSSLATGTAGAGTQLTTDNSGGILQFNTLLKDRWDNYRLTPDTIWLNSQEMISLKVLIVKNGGAPLIRMVGDLDKAAANIVAGAVVGEYLDPIRGRLMKIRVHPFQSPGTILFTTKEAPYAGSKVPGTLAQMICRQEYYSTLWPQRTRKREYGVYVDETLCCYFPPAFGVINNVAPTTS